MKKALIVALILGLLVIAATVFLVLPKEAKAAPANGGFWRCMNSCMDGYNRCVQGCGGRESCINGCEDTLWSCEAGCSHGNPPIMN